MRKWIHRVWITVGLAAVLALGWSYQARGVDDALLSSDGDVRVTRGRPALPTLARSLDERTRSERRAK